MESGSMEVDRISDEVAAALGKRPLTTLIRDVDLLNVFTGEIYPASIGIYRNKIVSVGKKAGELRADLIIDGAGKTAIPGLIDTHLHIESCMITPANFAAAVLPHGTTTVVADPHEIANVLGKSGVRMMLDNSKGSPLRIFFFAPTCVPECGAVTSGAEITPADVEEMLAWNGIAGLGEVMDFPGVISGNEKMMDILEMGRKSKAVIDGHCVFLTGNELNAYVTAGPEADHENFNADSAIEKLRAGMYVKLRGPHLLDVGAMVSALNRIPKPWNVIFVTDDVMPDNLLKFGHLDFVCRTFIEAGMDPVEVVRGATLRAAQHMRFYGLGAIAPGRVADVLLVDKLEKFNVDTVIANGALVAKNGKLVVNFPRPIFDSRARNTVKVKHLTIEDVQVKPPIEKDRLKLNVIDFTNPREEISDMGMAFLQLVLTKLEQTEVEVRDGNYLLGDLATALVFERHGKTGARGFAFVRGLIKKGAIASTVAHDAHNLVILGTNPQDMLLAAHEVTQYGGGIAATQDGKLLASIELPLAGLMSEEGYEVVGAKMMKLREAFKEMGVLDHPYMPIISMLTLSVIPRVRITDKGLFDVESQQFVNSLVTN
jgi:adenine deaminase